MQGGKVRPCSLQASSGRAKVWLEARVFSGGQAEFLAALRGSHIGRRNSASFVLFLRESTRGFSCAVHVGVDRIACDLTFAITVDGGGARANCWKPMVCDYCAAWDRIGEVEVIGISSDHLANRV